MALLSALFVTFLFRQVYVIRSFLFEYILKQENKMIGPGLIIRDTRMLIKVIQTQMFIFGFVLFVPFSVGMLFQFITFLWYKMRISRIYFWTEIVFMHNKTRCEQNPLNSGEGRTILTSSFWMQHFFSFSTATFPL